MEKKKRKIIEKSEGSTLSRKENIRYFVISYIGFFIVGYLFYKSIVISLIIGIASCKFKGMYQDYLDNKRREILLGQFKDLMYGVLAGTSSGNSISDALKNSRESLVRLYSDDSPIVKEVDYMVESFNYTKMYEDEILYDFANRVGAEDVRNFVDVYVQCKHSGGNIQKVIMNTIEVITEKMSIQREIKVLVAQKQMEGRVVTFMPIGILAFLNLVSPEYLWPMYSTLAGRLVMTMSLIGFGFAIVWIARILDWK